VFGPVLESSSGLLGVLFGSRACLVLRWTIPVSVLVEVASWSLFLAAMSSHVRDEGDGLAYPLLQPMHCSYQLRGHGLPVRCHPIPSLLISEFVLFDTCPMECHTW
jgi:hypothetical protein